MVSLRRRNLFDSSMSKAVCGAQAALLLVSQCLILCVISSLQILRFRDSSSLRKVVVTRNAGRSRGAKR